MFDTPSTSNEFDKYDEPRLHMERLLKAHLVEFDISLRILCPLEKAEINQLGRISVETLEKFLAYHGLSLAK